MECRGFKIELSAAGFAQDGRLAENWGQVLTLWLMMASGIWDFGNRSGPEDVSQMVQGRLQC